MLEDIVYSNYDVYYYDDAPEPVLPDRSKKSTDDDAEETDDTAEDTSADEEIYDEEI